MIIESFYSKYKNHSQEKINTAFHQACSDGNLDEVRYLLISPELEVHSDIHYYNDDGLAQACWEGHLEIVKYLLTSPELKEHAYLNDHKEKDCGSLLNACGAGHLEIVKYLLNSPDLKEHAIINWSFMPPIGAACEEGYLEIVKYLLTSPELKEHSIIDIYTLVSSLVKDQLDVLKYLTKSEFLEYYNIHENSDILFQRAIYHEANECIKYLIFDLNIDLTNDIKKHLEITEDNKKNHTFINQIKIMFTARELENELQHQSSNSEINNKKKIKL